MTERILAVVTSTDEYQKVGYRTGLWLGELTHFQDACEKAGMTVDVASPKGGKVPLDPESLKHVVMLYGRTDKKYKDRAYMDTLDRTLAIADVDPDQYDAVFLAGGHGAMFDFRTPEMARLLARFAEAGKVVAAVCHGPAGLLDVTLSDGTKLLDGKKVTGFSWLEEAAAIRRDAVPFNLEEELGKQGEYVKAPVPMAKHVVVDGLLITGQNPTSATGVGDAVVELLRGDAARDLADTTSEARRAEAPAETARAESQPDTFGH